YHWGKDGSITLLAAHGFANLLVSYSPDGSRHDLAPAGAAPGTFALGENGQIAFLSQSGTRPQEIWIWDQKNSARQVTHLNGSWLGYVLSAPEFYTYKSFDGTEIEAALLKPQGAAGSKLPLIVLIHGGPTGRWQDSIETWGQLLAARGYEVFYPN